MSNRTARTNVVNSAFNETYTYDGLNQLASFARGSHTQAFDYDALGNWDSLTTDGGTPQTRTANKQNEITSISGATTPTYDANGNMTRDETGKQYVFDAWNRLKEVKSSGGTTLKTYGYDGLNRRVSETASGTTTDLYYSAAWQVLEERVSGTAKVQYVWSPVYVDALICRDRDTDGNGTLEERLYVIQDANFNVTALVDVNGNVVERYAYTPFGVVTIYDANWIVRASSLYAMTYLFQGRPRDPVTGNDNNRNREYRPPLGRPLQVDMLRFGAGDVNFYRWEGNNPVNLVDPSGLDEPNRWSGVIGVVFGPVGSAVNALGPSGTATAVITPPPAAYLFTPQGSAAAVGILTPPVYNAVTFGAEPGCFYGRHCGPPASNRDPVDCYDAACQAHDSCLAGPEHWFDPVRKTVCELAFCLALRECQTRNEPRIGGTLAMVKMMEFYACTGGIPTQGPASTFNLVIPLVTHE